VLLPLNLALNFVAADPPSAQTMPNRLILLVDDNHDDRFLLKRAFTKAGIVNPLREATSGNEAIEYLRGEGKFSDRAAHPMPGIILLDLNMPAVDGFQVLQWIRAKLPVQGMLVIVLSRADEMRLINRAYALGANSFLTKPGSEDELQELIKTFKDYWLLRNKPPDIKSQD
jgi:CheY-like chemotaxis protein